MRVIIKEVGQEPRIANIENTLEALQQTVGGYIETVYLDNDIILICDEEGKVKGKSFNFDIGIDYIVGTALFVKDNGEDFTDIDEATEKAIMHLFNS